MAQGAPGRILSVDFWRGFALLTIFVNHIPGNVLENLTHRNIGFSDATELFVLFAGIAAGLVFWARLDDRPLLIWRMIRRAFQLYSVHIFLVVFCGALIAYASISTADPRFLEAFHFDILLSDPLGTLVAIVDLRLQPSYLNILPLYSVMLLMLPVMLLLAQRGLWVMLGASAALYLATQVLGMTLPSFPHDYGWFLNPFAWQFLFAIGVAIGITLREGRLPEVPKPVFYLACVWLAVGALVVLSGFRLMWEFPSMPRFLWDSAKTELSLVRLCHVLALVCVVSRIAPVMRFASSEAGAPIRLLGRHSLAVFTAGTILAIGSQLLRAIVDGGHSLDMVLITMGIGAQFALAGALEWQGQRTARQAQARRAQAASAG